MQNGKLTSYYESGRIESSYNYDDGDRKGLQIYYEEITDDNYAVHYKRCEYTIVDDGRIVNIGINSDRGQLVAGDIFECEEIIYKIVRGTLTADGWSIRKSTNLLVKQMRWKLDKTDIVSENNSKKYHNVSQYKLVESNGNSHKFTTFKKSFEVQPMFDAVLYLKWNTVIDRDDKLKTIKHLA